MSTKRDVTRKTLLGSMFLPVIVSLTWCVSIYQFFNYGLLSAHLATFSVLVATVLVKLKKTEMERKAARDPVPGFPSAKGAHWLVGHTIMMRNANFNAEGFAKTHEKVYVGSADPETGVASLWFFHIPSVVVLQANDVKKILNSSSTRRSNRFIDNHVHNILGRRNLISLTGKHWRIFRNAVHKSFTQAVVKQSRHAMHRVGNTMADSLINEIRTTKKRNEDMDSIIRQILPLMKFVTVDAFGLGILDGFEFGCSERLKVQPLVESFDYLTSELVRRFRRPWDPTSFLYGIPTVSNRKYHIHRSRLRNFVRLQIAKARSRLATEDQIDNEKRCEQNNPDNHCGSPTSQRRKYDLMTNLIKAASVEANKHPDDRAYAKMVEETLNDVFLTLLFGAYETASITLTYALYLLATHPGIQNNCVEEVQSVMPRRNLTNSRTSEDGSFEASVEDLPYTKAVIMETLRLFPAAPVTRRNLEKPLKLPSNGRVLETGQLVNISIWCVQRSEFNFPRPEEMIPERWVRKKKEQEQDHTSRWEERGPDDDEDVNNFISAANLDAFCAFAHGARNCVGKVFAVQETVIILACLVKKLKFELISPDYRVTPTICGLVQQPRDLLPMKIRIR